MTAVLAVRPRRRQRIAVELQAAGLVGAVESEAVHHVAGAMWSAGVAVSTPFLPATRGNRLRNVKRRP